MGFETVTAENLLEQFLTLSPADQYWLREQLDQLDAQLNQLVESVQFDADLVLLNKAENETLYDAERSTR